MFDHLSSDPSVAGDLSAVRRRAARLRTRRWAVLGTAGAGVTGVALALTLGGGAPGPVVSLVLDSPTPSATEPLPGPSAAAEPSPTPTPLPTVHSTPSPGPSPTPSPTCAVNNPFPGACPDGKPGWSGGLSSCNDAVAADLPAAKPDLFEGVTAAYLLPRSRVAPGERIRGALRFTSTRSDHVTFNVDQGSSFDAVLLGQVGGAIHSGDVLVGHKIDLAPGGSQDIDLGLVATSCGDGVEDPDHPLPAGSYDAGIGLHFDSAALVGEATPSADPSATAVPASGSFAVRTAVTVS